MNASDILTAVRRALWIATGKVAAFILVLILGLVWLSDKTHSVAVGVALAVVVVFQVTVGQYIPIKNRHESLLSEYGKTYVAEAEHAIKLFGMRKLISTRWFETYAAEFCRRRDELNGNS